MDQHGYRPDRNWDEEKNGIMQTLFGQGKKNKGNSSDGGRAVVQVLL